MNRSLVARFLTAQALILSTLGGVSGCAPDAGSAARDASPAHRVELLERASPAERRWFPHQLIPSDDMQANQFGYSVAISGTTALVGAPGVSAAYVFVLAEDGWHQQAKLLPPSDFAEKDFGKSVAISGDTLLVGALPRYGATLPGAAYVYVRSGSSFSAPTPLTADDGEPGHQFGWSVAIAGDLAVVGAIRAVRAQTLDAEGAAYVFARSGATWTQTEKLFAPDDEPSTQFGWSVAVSSTTVLVGASLDGGDYSGSAFAYSRSGGSWPEPQKLRPADAFQGDEFGHSVAVTGDVAVVGARRHRGQLASSGIGYRRGAAFVYTRAGSVWTEAHRLFADDAMDSDWFGSSVSVSGDTVLVGAPNANSVYAFDSLGNSTLETPIGGRGEIPFFGDSLALDGDVAVVGSEFGDSGAYALEFRATDGSACEANLDCSSRQCVAGVCCNVACSGACETCSTGSCMPLPQSPGTPSCAPYLCGESGGACPSSCRAPSECVDTHYCRARRCVPRLPNGDACTEARDCESGRCVDDECAGTAEIGARCSNAVDCETGFCVDGFCCDQRCDEACEACDLRGGRGTCSPVSGPPHGERPACESDGTVCGGECDGEHTAECAYPTGEVDCGTDCSDGMQTDRACNAQGACEPSAHSCGSYACADDERTCRTTCDSFSNCAAGFTCQDGSCEVGPTCLDELTAQGTDGEEKDCSPYLCESGSCRTTCDASTDCRDDTVCTREGHCVPTPLKSPPSTESGCGCRLAPPPAIPGAPSTLWVVAALAAWVARRARKPLCVSAVRARRSGRSPRRPRPRA